MMKKNRTIYFLLALVCLGLQSCLFQEEDYFDDSSANRATADVKRCSELLEAAPNGWVMEYYVGKDYSLGGITLLCKFDGQRVTMASQIAGADETVSSLYSVKSVQKMAPIFENLKGNFSGSINILTDLDATMSPVLNTMQGDGSLSTRDLSLSGVKAIDEIADAVKQPSLKDMKVKDMTLDFTIKDGRVETKPFDIKMGDYTLNLSGSTGLDQTIDYSGKVKLPASVGNISKLMTLDLKIGGSFTSPKVSVDTKSMANQAVEAVADEAISKLGQKLGLDSAATANKDSIKQKVTEKAAEKALDFLKKKLK